MKIKISQNSSLHSDNFSDQPARGKPHPSLRGQEHSKAVFSGGHAATNKLRAPIQGVLQNPRGIKYVYSDTPIGNTCRRPCTVVGPDQVEGEVRPDRIGGFRIARVRSDVHEAGPALIYALVILPDRWHKLTHRVIPSLMVIPIDCSGCIRGITRHVATTAKRNLTAVQ